MEADHDDDDGDTGDDGDNGDHDHDEDDDDGDGDMMMMGEVWTTCWPTSGPASQLLASELRYHLSLEQNDNRIKHYEGHYEANHPVQ